MGSSDNPCNQENLLEGCAVGQSERYGCIRIGAQRGPL